MLSATSVKMLDLRRLVDGIDEGTVGVPEFQRDFDWTEADMKSLLSTIFSGWPSGSLLVLEGTSQLFSMRPIECAPLLTQARTSILDGQQRLTSVYQALCGVGETAFAVKWDMGDDQDIDESLVSYPMKTWLRYYASVEDQLKHRIVPVSSLRSPTAFFEWRDNLLERVEDQTKSAVLKSLITDLYSYKLSAIHEYQFPVVALDERTSPDAIARIFEKVNKTGQKLGVFDLMVAKTFEPNWNLRNKWESARADNPALAMFLGDDGMALLQAMALLHAGDVRQQAVLSLSKQVVHSEWEAIVDAAEKTIHFLIRRCGVARGDLLPYPNLLGPLIALFKTSSNSELEITAERWFWYSAFASSYDAAANTRLVAHFKAVRDGNPDGFKVGEPRLTNLLHATRKTQKSVWNGMVCAFASDALRSAKDGADSLAADVDTSSLFSFAELAQHRADFPEVDLNLPLRSVLNLILVPRRFNAYARQSTASETVKLAAQSELGPMIEAQLPDGGLGPDADPGGFFERRIDWTRDFLARKDVNLRRLDDQDDPLGRYVVQID